MVYESNTRGNKVMAPVVEINYLAVLAAAVLNMAIGALWYGPVFGRSWMSLTGLTESDIEKAKEKGMGRLYLAGFAGALVMSYVLAHIIDFAQATTLAGGAVGGIWIWLGFIAPVLLGTVLWEGKPVRLYLLNTAYYLVALTVMGIVLAVWV